jgi:ATP-binding cassette, subfamily B, multidrug efflux pump
MSSPTMQRTERIQTQRGPGGGPLGGAMVGQKAADFGASARRLLRRLGPHRWHLALVAALAVVSVTLASIGPWLLGKATDLIFAGVVGRQLPAGITKEQAIDAARAAGDSRIADLLSGVDVIPGQGIDFRALGALLLVVAGVYLVSAVLSYVQGYVLNDVVQGTVYRMRADVEDKLNRLPLRYFDRQPRGELLSRVTNDIDNVAQTMQQTLSQVLTSLLTVVAVVSIMIAIAPVLALVAVATVPLAMFIAGRVMRRSQTQFISQWRHTGTVNARVEEAYTGHALVKVFGRRAEVTAAFDGENEELYRSSMTAQFLSGLIMPVMMFVGNLNYVIIAVLGGLRVASGAMSLGEVQAFIQYSRQFTQPVTQIASMVNLMQSGVASAERVFELLDAEEEPVEASQPEVVRSGAGRVVFEDVSFRYDPDRPLIKGLSLTVEPGQTVAIVGPTGAGKTTLVNLLMRFYDLDGGRITLDGVDISAMRRGDVRARTGMVLQDTWLFRGTIGDNIAYGRPDAADEEVVAAARATYVDRFVRSLPAGYDTVIDDDGGNVSAGERQLITIARAFLSDPDLLILDEATSSVDTRTERLVQQAMAALRSDRTSFVIAHRLSTIRDADLILVMDGGRLVEQGSHPELIAAGGAYAALYRAQFSGPDHPVDEPDPVGPSPLAAASAAG